MLISNSEQIAPAHIPKYLIEFVMAWFMIFAGQHLANQMMILWLPGFISEPRPTSFAIPIALAGAGISFSMAAVMTKVLGSRWAFVAATTVGSMVAAVIMFVMNYIVWQQAALAVIISMGLIVAIMFGRPGQTVYGKSISLRWHLMRLAQYRYLIRLWISYRIQSRYSQTVLGLSWIILLPLSFAAILALVFSQIVRAFEIGDVPYISFFLAGLLGWNFLANVVQQSGNTLVLSMNIIKQINLPQEVLILTKLGEILIDTFFVLISVVFINALLNVYPTINLAYLPIVLIIEGFLLLGLMLFLSYLSVLVRDIPQLAGVVVQLLFYVTPVLYPASIVPSKFKALLLLNPLVPIINAYRAILVYGQPPALPTLITPAILSVLLTYFGYAFFKKAEHRIADLV